ncbi:MAG: galactokinase, partial [Pseudonocardiales bacterium]|nr:galactokinase [Pseudonocardiales bacterium]
MSDPSEPAQAELPAELVECAWRAPGRVNLIGEHTDYNDGFCLPMAIPHGCTATVSPLAEPVLEVISAQREAPVEVALDELRPGVLTGPDEWAGYAAGVAWALAERGHQLSGLSITIDSDVPAGAGLSSSAALECSVAAALNDRLGLNLDRS